MLDLQLQGILAGVATMCHQLAIQSDLIHPLLEERYLSGDEIYLINAENTGTKKLNKIFALLKGKSEDVFLVLQEIFYNNKHGELTTYIRDRLTDLGKSHLIWNHAASRTGIHSNGGTENVSSSRHPPKQTSQAQRMKSTNETKKILVIGSTGNGKSALCNRILTPDGHANSFNIFVESDDVTSETKETIGHSGKWSGMNVYVIDTPGMNDTDGVEANHLIAMIDFLKDQHDIHAILLVFNTHQDRFDSNIQRLICLLTSIFKSADFWDHVALVFTKNFAQVKVDIEKKRLRYGAYVADIVKRTGLEAIKKPASYFVDSKDFQDIKTKDNFSFLSAWVKSLDPIGTDKLQQPDEMYLTNNYTKMREMTEQMDLKDQQLKMFTDKAAREKKANELYHSLRGTLDGAGWPGNWGNTDRGSASASFRFQDRQINADEQKDIRKNFAKIVLRDGQTGQYTEGTASYSNDGVNSYEVRRSSACHQFINLGFVNGWWDLGSPEAKT